MPEAPDSRESLVDVAIAEYLRAKESPCPFDVDEWLARHPHAADALCEFLRDEGVFREHVSPLFAAPDSTRSLVEAVTDSTLTLGHEPRQALRADSRTVGFEDFEIVQEVARGGMGVVYRARQRSLNRIVALKMVLGGSLASSSEAERLYREAEAAAGLDHPNIVPVYAVGEHESRPFFAMKLIEGDNLSERATDFVLRPREAAALVATVSRAVYHAHQRGVLHRDLKPSNILLDESGAPHVTDFGLARKLDAGASTSGAVAGTPSYMAPEQARGQKGLTTAVDVYGLGGVLYHLLTGAPPFKAESTAETLLLVLRAEPVAPRTIRPDVPRDLETICLKCLAKDPVKRYGSAAELADDLDRWLGGEPILARPTGRVERAGKWARRNPVGAALAAVSVLLLVTGVGGAVAVAYSRTLSDANRSLSEARDEAQGHRNEAEKQRTRAQQQQEEARRRLYLARMHQANLAIQNGNTERVIELLAPFRFPAADESDLRGFEWHYLWRQARGDVLVIRAHDGGIDAVAYSPDGKTIATGGGDGTVRLWDAATGRERAVFDAGPHRVTGVEFVGPTWLIAGLATTTRGELRVWDHHTRREVRRVELAGRVAGIAVSPDGKQVAVACDDGVARVVEAATGRVVSERDGRKFALTCVAFSGDGGRLAAGDAEGAVFVWDRVSDRELPRPQFGFELIRDVRFGPDGNVLLVAEGHTTEASSQSGSLQRLEFHSGQSKPWSRKSIGVLEGRSDFRQARLLPGGTIVAAGGDDGSVRMIDLRRSTKEKWEVRRYSGHTGPVHAVAVAPDGRFLATGGVTRTEVGSVGELRVWDLRADRAPVTVRALAYHTDVSLSPDGLRIAAAFEEGKKNFVRVCSAVTGRELYRVAANNGYVYHALFSPDGQWLAAAMQDGAVVWRADTGTEQSRVRPNPWNSENALRAAFSPDSKHLAIGSGNAEVVIHDVEAKRDVKRWRINPGKDGLSPSGWICCVAYSPDGQRLLTCSEDSFIRVWRLATGACELTFTPNSQSTFTAEFSPDGQSIAAAGQDGSVTICDASNGRRRVSLSGHDRGGPVFVGDTVNTCRFTADGERLVTAAQDGTVRVWSVDVGQELLTLRPFDDMADVEHRSLQTATIAPNGSRILANSRGFARVIDIPSAEPVPDLDAAELVHTTFARLGIRDEVVASLRNDPMLTEAVRNAAIKLAQSHSPRSAAALSSVARAERVAVLNGKSERYDRLLRLADAALKVTPGDHEATLARGLALYHLDRHEDAARTLQSVGSWPQLGQVPEVEEGIRQAILANSLYRLGRLDDARTAFGELTRLRTSYRDLEKDKTLTELYWEARGKIGPPQP